MKKNDINLLNVIMKKYFNIFYKRKGSEFCYLPILEKYFIINVEKVYDNKIKTICLQNIKIKYREYVFKIYTQNVSPVSQTSFVSGILHARKQLHFYPIS